MESRCEFALCHVACIGAWQSATNLFVLWMFGRWSNCMHGSAHS